MISRRTKTLLWLSRFPLLFVIATAGWLMIDSAHLTHARQDTYFLVFHFHLVWLLGVSAAFLVGGLVSLFVDKRNSETK